MTAAAEPPRPHAIRTQNEQNNMKVPGSDALAGAENAITDKNLHMQNGDGTTRHKQMGDYKSICN